MIKVQFRLAGIRAFGRPEEREASEPGGILQVLHVLRPAQHCRSGKKLDVNGGLARELIWGFFKYILLGINSKFKLQTRNIPIQRLLISSSGQNGERTIPGTVGQSISLDAKSSKVSFPPSRTWNTPSRTTSSPPHTTRTSWETRDGIQRHWDRVKGF